MILPLLGAAAGVALLELDAASAAQLMISRPAVFGPALGAAFGQPALGTLFGLLWELITLDAPIGGHLPISATAAAGVSLLLSLGDGGLAPHAALPCGVAAGWAHRQLENVLRRRRAACAALCEERLAEGRAPGFGRLVAGELGKQAAMTFALLAGFVLLRPVLAGAWASTSLTIKAAFQVGLWTGPWIGVAALLRALRVAA